MVFVPSPAKMFGLFRKVPVFEKKLFSMCTDEVLAHLNNLPNKPTDVVLFGLEAHVCVTQVRKAFSPRWAASCLVCCRVCGNGL